MDANTMAIAVLLGGFFVMIFLRFPIAYAVGLASVLCLMVQGLPLSNICQYMVKGISSFSLMAVPFFITMGVLMGSGGISDKLIALALAERCGDTLIVHIEKALYSYTGVYPAFVQAFAAAFGGNCQWLNREDDLGLEGLRRAKLSYYPDLLLEKYTAQALPC